MLLVLVTGCTPASGLLTGLPDGVWYWGDLHAHSAWSWDGCEEWETDCAVTGDRPGEYFFEHAADNGLDFAALTDHAEADRYYPDGLDSESQDIWPGQQDLVQQAQGTAMIPLLGYEWTAFREGRQGTHLEGTHRTVLLSDPSACAAYRVPGWSLPDGKKEHAIGEMVYTQDDPDHANTPADLWSALTAASDSCDPVRWLTFAHHPAYETPQVTDWTLPDNNPAQEQVVEIYSEHGSSECVDLSAEGCSWRINTAQGYYPDGSIQTALAEGYRLGFVGGTDSHDARPGSLDDGPSHIAHWLDEDGDALPDTPKQHFTAGGLTGVWLDSSSTLGAEKLLETIASRTTAASSGPRPALIAAAAGQDGQLYPPGSIVPHSAMPAEIVLELSDPGAAYDEIIIERVGADGVLTSESALELTDTWRSSDGDWTYLRIRYRTGDDEERVWLSPWFEEQQGCSCSSPGSSGPWGLALFLLWWRRLRS